MLACSHGTSDVWRRAAPGVLAVRAAFEEGRALEFLPSVSMRWPLDFGRHLALDKIEQVPVLRRLMVLEALRTQATDVRLAGSKLGGTDDLMSEHRLRARLREHERLVRCEPVTTTDSTGG